MPLAFFFSLLFSSAVSLAGNNPDFSPLPPKAIYHVGQKKHLQENERQGIPDEVWEKSIMGRETRFGLVPYRRGLFGGKSFDSLEQYAAGYLRPTDAGKKIPWVMKITIKDECRKPESVTDLGSDQNYLRWLFTNASDVMKNFRYCINLKAAHCHELVTGTQPLAMGAEENLCDELMQKMLVETKVRVVRDTETPSSWYLRDRACIEKMEAGPEAVLEILAHAQWDMASRIASLSPERVLNMPGGYGNGSMLVLLGALRDTDEAPAPLLQKLREKLALSDITLLPPSPGQAAGISWIREAGPAVVDAFLRCREKGQGGAFRDLAKAYEQKIFEIQGSRDPLQRSASLLEQAAQKLAADMKSACR